MRQYGLRISRLTAVILYCLSFAIFADSSEDPCAGSLLSIVNRPTALDSTCVVPNKKVLAEAGLQLQTLVGTGTQQNLPETQIRIGLPLNNEFNFTLPNFIHQTAPTQSGFNASIIGLKHEFHYQKNWVTAVEALITLPSGSDNFGSKGLGTAINGLFSYNINAKFNLSGLIGVNTLTDPRDLGGGRYNSFNPDAVLTWSPSEKLNFFAEVYGETKTGAHSASGYNTDAGVIYLIYKYLAIDAELGQRLSGTLGGFQHYVGAGFTLEFG